MSGVPKRVHEALFLCLVSYVARGFDERGIADRAVRLLVCYAPWLLTEENVFLACRYLGLSDGEAECVSSSMCLLVAHEFDRVGLIVPVESYYLPELRPDRLVPTLTSLEAAQDMAAFDRALELV